ncbi:MFS transporter [Nocardia sp. NBC_01327]|uniref:MFS transporter n=1 Tax=Nocardia sp. NBC_01327 TaxID=2903593 RepID=UPI002E10CD86|nr:MFS transporter [Nocardia sp. NBC_01327]
MSACLIAVFMQMLDLTIVHTAMPALARDLGASPSAELLIVSAYGLTFACALPTAARIGDVLGRRVVFPAALAGFAVASLWCGICSSATELVLARAVSGIAAALASAQTIAIITAAFPQQARATAFGLYGAVAGLAGMTGPTLGGALIDANPLSLGWRAVFLINIPLAGVAVALAIRRARAESSVAEPERATGDSTQPGREFGPSADRLGSGERNLGRRAARRGRVSGNPGRPEGTARHSAYEPGMPVGYAAHAVSETGQPVEECARSSAAPVVGECAYSGAAAVGECACSGAAAVGECACSGAAAVGECACSGAAAVGECACSGAAAVGECARSGAAVGVVRRLDVWGAVLSAAGLGLLVYPLTYGRELGWPPGVFVLLGLSGPVLAVFVAGQRRRVDRGLEPLVRLELFADRGFGVGAVLMAVFYGVFTALLFTVSVTAQSGLGWSASHTGLVMLPFAVGAVAGALSSPMLVSRFGNRVLTLGVTVFAVGLGATANTVHAAGTGLDIRELAWPVFAAGAGMGWFAAPLPPLMIAGVADRAAGSASGIVPTVQQVGSSVGVAVLGMVFFARVAAQSYLAALTTVLWIMAGVSALLAVLTLALPRRRA